MLIAYYGHKRYIFWCQKWDTVNYSCILWCEPQPDKSDSPVMFAVWMKKHEDMCKRRYYEFEELAVWSKGCLKEGCFIRNEELCCLLLQCFAPHVYTEEDAPIVEVKKSYGEAPVPSSEVMPAKSIVYLRSIMVEKWERYPPVTEDGGNLQVELYKKVKLWRGVDKES